MRALLVIALAGCMKIYPSSELPDIEIEWSAEDCASTPEIVLSLVAVDDGTVTEHVAACSDQQTTIEDLDRVRYRVDGFLLAPDSTVSTSASQEVDLRNGINQEAYLYFAPNPYVRITWVFEAGSSCESLEADTVDLDFFDPDYGRYTMSTSCAIGAFVGYPFGDGLTMQARAVSRRITVAASERSEPIELMPPDVVEVGPLTLVPCGSDCP